MRYTKDQKQWIKDNYLGTSSRALAEAFNNKFGTDLPWEKMRYFKRNNGLKSGHITRFSKKDEPWNKGTKGICKSNRTSFKKGSRPHNYKPVGSTRIESKDGYKSIKVAEHKWVSYSRYMYEKYHQVKLKRNETVRFLDQDKTNFSRDNLVKVTNAESAVINHQGYSFDDPELSKIGINIAKMKILSYKKFKMLNHKE